VPLGHGDGKTVATGGLTQTREAGEVSGRLRPLRPDDLPDLVALRRRSFRSGERDDPVDLAAYCDRVFFRNPWQDAELPSLVYEDTRGRPVGFIGSIPRRMIFQDRPIRVVVATQLMVAPEARGLAGRNLVRALLSGPQDLTISDTANEPARRIWASLGAANALLYGFTWERVLRPMRHLRSEVPDRQYLRRFAAFVARPVLAAGDAIVGRIPSDYRFQPPAGALEPLDPTTMVAHADRVFEDYALRPVYDVGSLGWLLAEAAEKRIFGALSSGMVRDQGGQVAGWFIYYGGRRKVGQVLQLAARRGAHDLVMSHMLFDAFKRGMVAIKGRLDPPFISTLGTPQFCLRHEAPWTLVHSRRPEIMQAVERGDSFLSRLDGEWWLSF
jgi:hypothetical protein